MRDSFGNDGTGNATQNELPIDYNVPETINYEPSLIGLDFQWCVIYY